MKSFIMGTSSGAGTSPSTSATNYQWVHNTNIANAWNATQTNRDVVVPHAMTLDRLHMALGSAPGAGKSYVFTLMVNGSASALTCTVADANTTAADDANTVSLAAGDLISIRSVPSGTPAATGNMWWSLRQDATDLNGVIGGSSQNVSNSAVNFNSPMSCTSWNATEANVYVVMPTAGVLKNLFIVVSSAPGAAKSYTFDIMKNGSTTGVQVVVSGAVQTAGSDTTNTVSVAAGDLISIRSTPAGTPTAANVTWSFSLDPTTDGESVLLYGDTGSPSTASTTYEQPQGRGANSWQGAESGRDLMIGAVTVKALYIKLGTAPDNGPGTQSYAFTVRDDLANTAATVTISEATTTANITGQSIVVADDSRISLQSVPANTPAATTVKSGILFFITPAGSASQIKTLAGVTQATVKVASGVAAAGIKKVSGVTNV